MSKSIIINSRFLTQPITGVQRFAIELSLQLKDLLPNCEFIAPHTIIHHHVASQLNVKCVGYSKNGQFWEQVELPLYLKQNETPLLVNLCNTAPLLYNKSIITIHDLAFYHHPEWFSKAFSVAYNIMLPKIARKASQVITVSEYSKQDLITSFNLMSDMVEVIYQKASGIFNKVSPKEIISPYNRYILGVSSIDPRKNFLGLIKAFQAAQLTGTKLVIVGQQHKIFADNQLRQLIKGDDSIIFTGYVDDNQLVNLYCHAALFAYPSFFEGFGIPPLEAMACGCPTLVSNTTSLPEVCGNASWYVDPYNVDDIRAGLERVLADECLQAQLISNGYKRVKFFCQQESAQQLAKIIQKVSLLGVTEIPPISGLLKE